MLLHILPNYLVDPHEIADIGPFFFLPIKTAVSYGLTSYIFLFVFFLFCHTAQLAGSYFPDQGSNPCLLQWKCRVLTTGPPGNI